MESEAAVAERLTEYKVERQESDDWGRLDAESWYLVASNPFAFLVAVAFDRGCRGADRAGSLRD